MREITITVPLHKCMEKDPETGGRKGHMHMQAYPARVTVEGVEVGSFGFDINSTNLVFSFSGEHYHTPALEIWKAVKEMVVNDQEKLEERWDI